MILGILVWLWNGRLKIYWRLTFWFLKREVVSIDFFELTFWLQKRFVSKIDFLSLVALLGDVEIAVSD